MHKFKEIRLFNPNGEYELLEMSWNEINYPNLPIVNLWNRNISNTPTAQCTHLNNSGFWLAHTATRSPPLEPPDIHSLSTDV